MPLQPLAPFLRPTRIAVVGASPREGALGGVILRNIVEGGFAGQLAAVNPHHREIFGVPAAPALDLLPFQPDLIVVATPPAAVRGVVEEAAALGIPAAIVITAGLGHGPGSEAYAMTMTARRAGLRLIGPNCLGALSPGARLNASFATRLPRKGPLALISQSGAIAAGMVEWGASHGLGFSAVLSIGDAADIGFADCLDHFAMDEGTKAILMYVESISDARAFVSAARKAARVKPVLALKAGRHEEGARAAATHTGALAGADAVYEAAFDKAGCLRVLDLDELYAAAQTLALGRPAQGGRLAILTNGGGLGVLAVDRLRDFGGELATLSPETLARLDPALPANWSRANPVDIIGDAPPERYAKAMEALLADLGVDAIMAMNCPTALTSASDAAQAVIDTARAAKGEAGRKPVLSVWMGSGPDMQRRFEAAGIPSFETEGDAARGFSHLVAARRRLDALLEPIPADPERILPDRAAARAALAPALAEKRTWLTAVEAAALMTAYGIPSAETLAAADPDMAAAQASRLLASHPSCVVKILSRDIPHKSDVDGVRLGLTTPDAVREAAAGVLARARRLRPEARIEGVTVQPHIDRPEARELIIGMTADPTFGPVALFGHGGTAVEIINDRAVALMPVSLGEARRLVERTRISPLLRPYRNVRGVDREKLAGLIVRVSRIAEDHPEIAALDLNPVLADESGAIVVDPRVELILPPQRRPDFAVRPYPRGLEETVRLHDGRDILIRPLRATDQEAWLRMLERVSAEDMRMRFFASFRAPSPALVARLTQIDYAREMALVAVEPRTLELLGVARLHGDADHREGEYGLLVRTDWQGHGLGEALMERLVHFARTEGYGAVIGEVFKANGRMSAICRKLGFDLHVHPDDDALWEVRLDLRARQPVPA